jgi:hypothetical protein
VEIAELAAASDDAAASSKAPMSALLKAACATGDLADGVYCLSKK